MAGALPVLLQNQSGKIPDFFYCKICFELPEKVFQCRDGHTLCSSCFENLVHCPICRSRFDKDPPIRNRFFEELLDKLVKVECAYKENGCIEQPTREMVQVHQAQCLFNYERFGKLVNLCQLIDYKSCDFRFNTGNVEDAVQHFLIAHSCALTETDQFQMKLTGFQESIESNLDSACFWTPVISDIKERKCFLLTCAMHNGCSSTTGAFTCFSLLIPKSHEVSETLTMEYSIASDKDCHFGLRFLQNSMLLSKVESLLPNNLHCSIQIQSLKSHLTKDGSLLVNCMVRNSGSNNSSNTDAKVKKLEMIVCPIISSITVSKVSSPERGSGGRSMSTMIEKDMKGLIASSLGKLKTGGSILEGILNKYLGTPGDLPRDKIIVENLPESVTKDQIKNLFSQFGAIREIQLVKLKHNGNFCACDSEEGVDTCIVEFACRGSVRKVIGRKRIFMRKNGKKHRLTVKAMHLDTSTSPNKGKEEAKEKICQVMCDWLGEPDLPRNCTRDEVAMSVKTMCAEMESNDPNFEVISESLVFTAVQYGTLESVRCCVDKGIDINLIEYTDCKETNSRLSVLAAALLDSDKTIGLEKIKFLVEVGADICFKDKFGRSLLHMSVLWGSNDTVKFFLDKGLNVNAVDQAEETSLHSALLSGSKVELLIEKVKVLLNHGADLAIKTKKGQNPFNLVKVVPTKYQDQIREMLEKHREHA